MIEKKHIPQWKLDEVNELIELFNQFDNVAVIQVSKMSDKQVQDMRKTLRGDAVIKMSKKNLQIRAIEQVMKDTNKENLDKLAENISGQSALCFTNMNVFDLRRVFNENLWMVPAKPDQKTPVDIWVPEGDTGLPTGQVISELNMTLRLPTRIQNDTIWVREPTRTHKVGDFVDVKQAAVLKKLGVNPIESLIKIQYAWSNGEIYTPEIIYMDTKAFKQDIASAFNAAKNLAIEFGIIDELTIEPLIQKAYREALGIAFEIPVYIDELRNDYIQKAVSNGNALNAIVFGVSTTVGDIERPTSLDHKKKDEDEEEEEEVGIGGLFG
jgi:large subunit ribosomal protein L10